MQFDKFKMEYEVSNQGFATTNIWRPGLLGRGSETRGVEKFASVFMTVMPVENVAKAMRVQAEKDLAADGNYGAKIHFNKQINDLSV